MGAGPEAAVATMPDSEETVVLVTALDEDSDDEMSTDNGIKLIDRRKYMLYTALLAAVAVLAVCISAVALSSSALSPFHVRHTERLIQVCIRGLARALALGRPVLPSCSLLLLDLQHACSTRLL